MVFQNYALYPAHDGAREPGFALKLRKLPRAEIDRRVRDAARDARHRTTAATAGPSSCPAAQRQRVALGRAIVRQPQVFLFDEPLSNLDAKLRVQMRREIARLHQQLGTTMIYVTHDQVEAMTLGDRIVVLAPGRVQQIDTPTALYERPRNTFVASFIGTPPMNLVEGRLSEGRFEAEGFGLATRGWPAGTGATNGQRVVLGVRPEDLQPTPAPADSATSIAARVELVELLGGEALVHVRAGNTELTARIPSPVPTTGTEIRLTVRTRQGASLRRGFRRPGRARRVRLVTLHPCRAQQCPTSGKMDGYARRFPR